MSADNGIYILETNKAPNGKLNGEKEYRVKMLQNIESLYYDISAPTPIKPNGSYHSVNEFRPDDVSHCMYQEAYAKKYHSKNLDVQINNARDAWRDCFIHSDMINALIQAAKIEKEYNDNDWPVEYGISFIRIDRVF